jgi:serine protease Do
MKNLFLFVLTIFVASSIQAQNLSKIYKKVNSSVVVIKTINEVSAGTGDRMNVNTVQGQGSGVLISEDGLIWTASHVVHTADLVAVKFPDGDIYEAEVLSSNTLADVALIKISEDFQLKEKHIAKIGNSDLLQTRDDIFVIGAPRGLEQTLSKGIVSGRLTPDGMSDQFLPIEYIQTDASINPGNSGGPLFNMNGEVIGIASFILSEDGGFNGIGFGASSNVATKLLMESRNIWTGMEFVLLTNELARVFNLPQAAGVLVTTVSERGGIGNKLGLKGGYLKTTIEGRELLVGGDIILSIAGIELSTPEAFLELREKWYSLTDSDSFTVKYLRAGKIQSGVFIGKD